MGANVNNALFFLISTLFDLFLWLVILRVLLQVVRADFYNPISQFVWQVTQLPVKPLAAIIPRWRRLDLAAMLLGYLIAVIYLYVVMSMLGIRVDGIYILWLAFLKLITLTLKLYTFTVFVQAILSWFGPGTQNPAGSILWSLNEPLLRPIRRAIPALGGLDLTPLIAIIGLQVLVLLVPLAPVLR